MAPVDNPLDVFFDLVPTGAALFAPLYDGYGEVVDFRFVRLNPAGQRLLGLPAQPPHTFREHYPHSEPTGIFAQYRTAYLTGQASTYEGPYAGDGLDTYFRLVAQRSGELLVVNFTDMADLPRSGVEQALRASQAREQAARAEAEAERQRFHEVLLQLPAYVAVYQGPDHVYQFVNPPYQSLFPHRSFAGRSFGDAMPEANKLGVLAFFDHVYQTGKPYHLPELEGWFDFKGTGEPEQVFLNLYLQPLRNAQGGIDGVLDYSHNITEQVRARQQVEQLNQRLEARVQARTHELSEQQRLLGRILGQVPAAIATLSGPDHRYTFYNDFYQALSGHRAARGRSVLEVFPEVVEQGFIALLDRVYQTGEPLVGTAMPVQLHDASRGQPRQYYIDFVYQPLVDERQQVLGILAFILEVTDRVLARQQVEASQGQVQVLNERLAAINEELRATNEHLNRSNTQLRRTNVDLDTFVYTASHDLKAPITNIEGILAALRESLPPSVQQEAVVAQLLGLLDITVGRFLTTIDQLTDLTRLQQTYNEPAELLTLAPVVAGVVADLAPVITAAGAHVQVEVPPDLHVSFAPSSLRSIVYNLLSNAVKYRDAARSAQVWLRVEARPGAVVLSVRDNGLGLTASQQGRLFGVFQRLHTHVEGTGVGLYMIKRLIENAGADIAVTSAPGVGSTFTVTFPT